MKMKNNFDTVMKSAAEIACKEEYAELEALTDQFEYSFSDEFNEKMAELMQVSHRRRKYGLWKYLFIAAVVLLLNLAVVMADEELREKMGSIVLSIYENCVDLRNESFRPESKEWKEYRLTWIPDGYKELGFTDNSPDSFLRYFVNDMDDILVYSQYDDSSDVSVTYDEQEEIEKVSVCGTEGRIVSDGEIKTLFFSKDGYIFTISCSDPELPLMTIAENIK